MGYEVGGMTSAVIRYMSEECACPIEYYTEDNLQILCPNCHSIMGEHTANRYYKNNKNATMMELEDNCLLEGQAQSVRVQIPVVAPKKICKCCGTPIKKIIKHLYVKIAITFMKDIM